MHNRNWFLYFNTLIGEENDTSDEDDNEDVDDNDSDDDETDGKFK